MAVEYNNKFTQDKACTYLTMSINHATPEEKLILEEIKTAIHHVVRLPKYTPLFLKGGRTNGYGSFIPYFPLKPAYLDKVDASERIETYFAQRVRKETQAGEIEPLVTRILDDVNVRVMPGVGRDYYYALISGDVQAVRDIF